MRREQRRELRSDELMAGLGAGFRWGRDNLRRVGLGLVAVLGIGLLLGGLLAMRASDRDALRTELAGLTGGLDDLDPGGPPDREACEAALPRLVEISADEGNSAEGRTARYFSGVCQRETGNLSAAAESFEAAAGRSDLLSSLATFGLAGARRAAGQWDEAAAAYRELLDADSGFPADAALFGLAALEEERGRNEEALSLYERLQSEHATSAYRQMADFRAMRLEGGEETEPARTMPAR